MPEGRKLEQTPEKCFSFLDAYLEYLSNSGKLEHQPTDVREHPCKQNVDEESASVTMPRRQTVSRNGTCARNLESDFWEDVEKEGANLLRCISPLRMSEAPKSDVRPKKRPRKNRKTMTDKPVPFRGPQSVSANGDVVRIDNTQGTQLCKKRKRRRKRRKHAAENESSKSDKLVDSDGEENESAFSGKFSSDPEKGNEEPVVEQGETVPVDGADSQRTAVDPHQSTNSGTLKMAATEQNTFQPKRQKTLEGSENHNTKTKGGKRSLRESLRRQQAISQLKTPRSFDPQQAAKSTGFPRAGALIARFEAKRMQRIHAKRTSCKSSRIVVNCAETQEQETSFRHRFPSKNLTTSTAVSDVECSTHCVDSLKPHVTPTPARYCSVQERIADFSAKRQKRIRERRFSRKSTRQHSSDQDDSTAQVDCNVSASKREATRISEPNSQDPMPCVDQQPTPEQNHTFNPPGFHGVKARIAAFEEKQQRCNNRPKRKRLKNGKDPSTHQGLNSSTDCSQQVTPDADQHAATSTFTNPDDLESPILIKNKPTRETDDLTIVTSKSNHDRSHHESQVHQRNAAESFCSDCEDKTAVAPQSLRSPLVMSINQGGYIARSTKLLRRSHNRRRQNSGGSFSESDTSSALSHSSSDVAKKLTSPAQSCVDQTAQQSPPVESTDCTRLTVPSDSFKSSLIGAVQALHAKTVHRKHHRRKRDTRVSSSESKKQTVSDLVDVPSVDGRPSQRQSPSVSPAAKPLPASQPFGFIRFTRSARRPLVRRKETIMLERLFSSSEETDQDVASARAASQEFLRENPDLGDKEVAADCNDLGRQGFIFEDEGSVVDSCALDVVEIDNTSVENNAEENPSEELKEDPSCQKSKQSFKATEQNQPAFKTKPQNGLTQQELRNSKKRAPKGKKLTKKTRTKQTEPNIEKQDEAMTTRTAKEEGLLVDLKNRLSRRKNKYRKQKTAEKIARNTATRKRCSRDAKLKNSKTDGDGKKTPTLLATWSDAIHAVQEEQHSPRIQDNRESCQRIVPSFPVEWEDPLVPGMQQQMHRQYLQDRFFKLLSKQAKETHQTHRHPQKRSNKKKQQAENHQNSIRRITAELENDGWIDYTTLPEILTLQDPKRFIRRIKKK
ncbi:uncharacterized protein LOC119743122 [Patiria miniata]|uniref:Uncharacterized protein n=1 Tax=Patiria miniata TaxID=46514 RepID=A0A914BH44_PATMI|nr:uncharacterized protein LOC119743122 [Patiria miniata]